MAIIELDLDIETGTYKFINNYKKKKTVEIVVEANKIHFDFAYDEFLKDEIKFAMAGRWNPDAKQWWVKNNRHNKFQIAYLRGLNPYAQYEQPLEEHSFRVPLYPQQTQMANEGLTYRQVIWAAEMGLGKTLSAFMVIENSDLTPDDECWWVGPKSALAAFEVELEKWGLLKNCPSDIMTYEGLVKLLTNFPPMKKVPKLVVFDESSRGKNPTAKRSIAMLALSEKMRDVFGENVPYILELTGTPAPKSPADWYHQLQVAKPGYVREGDIYKFKDRLAYIDKQENPQTGGFYPKLIGWKDGEGRCAVCGQPKDTHDFVDSGLSHTFAPGANEIAKLYRRMKGLVSVYYKKDWMTFLPEKQYRILKCKPSRALLNAAKIIKDSSTSTIQALTRLRELSDGFQYVDAPTGRYEQCTLCNGSCRVEIPDYEGEELAVDAVKMVSVTCTNCNGSGKCEIIARDTNSVSSPKDDLLEEIIEDHEDDGRLVVYAGFTGSIDRIQETFTRKGWEYICVDGRGWRTSVHHWLKPKDMLQGFQNTSLKTGLPKVVYIAHPMSGGMGVTLTASREEVFFSNDFNGESRIQAEDRIHRPGMDVNKGAMITDLVNLPSDMLIIESHREKRRLQDMTLGQFNESLKLEFDR
jgi:SNF2 family DNA or RNA helicase